MAEFVTTIGTIDFGTVRPQSEKYSSIVVELNGAITGTGTVTLNDTLTGQVAPGHIWVAQVDSLGNQVVGTLANTNSIAVGASLTYVRFWIPWKPVLDGQELSVLAASFQITSDTASNGDFTLNLLGECVAAGDETCGIDNDNTHCAPGYSCQSNVCTMMGASVADASATDAKVADASEADASAADAHVADASVSDVHVADASVHVADASMSDAHVADASMLDVFAAADGSPAALATDACTSQTCDGATDGARVVAPLGSDASGDAATCTDSQCSGAASQGPGASADEGGCGCRIAHRDPANACLFLMAIGVGLALTRTRFKRAR